jgi:phosphatidylinositol-3-phosphatase
VSRERGDLCEDCGTPLEPRQRYCLGCGLRIGPRSPQLAEVLRRVRERFKEGDAARDGAAAAAAAAAAGPQGAPSPAAPRRPPRLVASAAALRLPPARISAFLVLVFLGFGVILGGAAGSRVSGSLAASSHSLKLVLPAVAPAAAPPSTPSSSSPGSSSEPPAAESTPTPASAEGPTTPAAKAAPAPTAVEPAAGGEGKGSGSTGGGSTSKLPPVKHLFVIMLSNQPYAAVFGPASTAPYLSRTLEHRGALLVRYDAVAHEQLANELALLSGQGPTAETAANCPNYTDLAPATPAADGQLLGNGCVYPKSTQTLAGQLTAKHLSWRSYAEGFDEPGTPGSACAHPVLGQPDPTASPGPSGGAYATFRNPFLYFHSVIDSPGCAAGDVGLDRLGPDLAEARRTPSFSYIVPGRCHDGNPTPCAPGAPAGLGPADAFLQRVVPEITGSSAYKDGGLLVITVDEAPSSGEFGDSSSCCGQPRYPNLAASPTGSSARGGGAVGALLLSPFIKGATTSQEPYNHFSLLRTAEDLFGLRHLGYAGLPRVPSFEASIFSAYKAH